IRMVRIRPCEVELLLVAFDTELKVFHTPLDYDASCKHSKRDVESPEFVLHKKPCFNCGDFSHLANDCRRRVQRETTRSQNHAYKSPPLRSSGHRPHGGSMRPSPRPAIHRVDRFPTDDLKFSSAARQLLSNDSLSLLENESFHFDIPSSSRPPAKPPDGNSRILYVKVMGDISEHNVPMPRLMLTQPTLVPNQEKSLNLLSHQGHKASQPSTECPMMIYGRNTPTLDVLFLHLYPP
nr:hypothetical protein [Tanacetum cinerariifolium]